MFILENPHPLGKNAKDCVKRACVLASGINYHDMAIMLNRYRKISGGEKFNSNKNYKQFIEKVLLGRKDPNDMQHAFEGHRYTVEDYADYNHTKSAILRCSKHLVACRYGDYMDTWDSGYKGVYIAWILPNTTTIISHIKKNYSQLCKGLNLKRYNYENY